MAAQLTVVRPLLGGTSTSSSTASCDTSKSPSIVTCLVADKYAVFVSPTGDDSEAGTKAKPVKTFAKATSLAGTAKSVIACSGAYTEALSITTATRIYGSFDCTSSWVYDATKPTVVAPTTVTAALNVAAGSAVVLIEDVQFKALDATTPSASSVAAFVKESTNVTLRRVTLAACNGAAGVTPALAAYTFVDAAALVGNAGVVDNGGAASKCTCLNATTTTRGAGGPPGLSAGTGLPTYDTSDGLGGNTLISCSSGGGGGDGSPAPTLAAAPGATTLGAFASDNWTPASGGDGQDGQPGQGGGGERERLRGGGSGACGGCGGKGGPGGKGGGASIALLSVNSTVALEVSTLTAANGGAGANGASGQNGQTGGLRGKGYLAGCDGGDGGTGASGAPGGGGAGGLSVGILYSGTVPTADADTKTTLGQPGVGGKGGNGAATTDDGIDGSAANTLAIP